MSIFFRREELAPALRKDRSLHDLAFVWRRVLQADLAALRTLWKPLVMGVRLLDLVRLFDFVVGQGSPGGADSTQNRDGQTCTLEQRAAR